MKYIFHLLFLVFLGKFTFGYEKYHFQLSSRHNETKFLEITYQYPSTSLLLKAFRDNKIVQKIEVSVDFDESVTQQLTPNGFVLISNDKKITFSITTDTEEFIEFQIFREILKNNEARDCISLENANFYGGPEQSHQQYWPIERQKFKNYSYVPKNEDFMSIAERYWLNSNGSYLYVSFETPLFIEQKPKKELCLIAKQELPYNVDENLSRFQFSYFLGVGNDVRDAHMKAIEQHLMKPEGIPDEKMARYPIWSTWARYKRDINETLVEKFADEIIFHGFNNSQLEIDDDWEECYGSLTINRTKFPDMKGLVARLASKGFRTTLWVHPFINKNCNPWYEEAISRKFVVFDHEGHPNTTWWNSEEGKSSYIDFTKASAIDFFVSRLHKLKSENNLLSFKFDAGESSWPPVNPVLHGEPNLHPGIITRRFVREMSQFGRALEVRTAWGTQNLPHYVRMADKDSNFRLTNNGLPSLVTTLLVFNMNGYPFVLPDMIGGNGYYGKPPTKELFVRWLEANIFMPVVQFSYVPWDFDEETVEITRNLLELREKVVMPVLMKAMKRAVEDGSPVNAPIWWIDPQNTVAHGIGDEFLVGEEILVAPILKKKATKRDIFLPNGVWKDANDVIYEGNQWILDYKAQLGTIPYFILHEKAEK
ncbi:myogenesis-regulating glycosidase-like [Culicoides brevitarsis]|uniref:myogenesis-regulating glycosidase-like n=1 Tax=Culicoides brevitarsis TaxID=469753 RepID=UPI00307B2C50